jgi:hypothetical protein
MKNALLAFILALTVTAWAQSANQTTPSDQKAVDPQSKCACCEKTASADHHHMHEHMQGCMKHAHVRDSAAKDEKPAAHCCAKSMQEGSCCGSTESAQSSSKRDNASADCCAECKHSDGHGMACQASKGRQSQTWLLRGRAMQQA